MGVTPAAEEAAAELYVTDASDADLAKAEALPKSSSDAELYELEPGRHVLPTAPAESPPRGWLRPARKTL